jgi:uncharacterized membrane protein
MNDVQSVSRYSPVGSPLPLGKDQGSPPGTPSRVLGGAGANGVPRHWRGWKHLIGIVVAVVLALGTAALLGTMLFSSNGESAIRWVGLGAAMFAILASPIHGLLLWIILEPYTVHWYLNINMPSGIPDLSLRRLAAALLTVVLVAQLATGKRKLRRIGLTEVSMVLFCVMAIPSIAAAYDGLSRSLQLFLDRFIIPFLAFVLAKNLYDTLSTAGTASRMNSAISAVKSSVRKCSSAISIGLDRVTAAMMVIAGYLGFVVFWEHLTGQPLFYQIGRTTRYTKSLRKIVGLLGNGACLATILAMIAPFAFYRFVRARTPLSRAFFGAMFALAVLGNFFVYNRGSWLALGLALIVMVLFEPEYRRILLPIMLIGAVLVAVFWGQVTSSAVVTERLSNASSIDFRVNMLEVAQRMIRDNLLFGVGFESFADHYIQYGGHWEMLAWDTPAPHNTFVLVATTMGLAGLLPYLMIFFSMLLEMWVMTRSFWRERGSDSALFVSGCAAVVAYMGSAVAIDLYFNTFTSLILFCIPGTIIGYASHLRAQQQALVAERERPFDTTGLAEAQAPLIEGV